MGLCHSPAWKHISPDIKFCGYLCLKSEKISLPDCLEPPNITDGSVAYNLTTYSENGTYTCRTGWDLFGDGFTECGPDGNWTGTRNCTIGSKCCDQCKVVPYGAPLHTLSKAKSRKYQGVL